MVCMYACKPYLRQVSQYSGFGEPREGDDRFVEEVDLSDQDVGALTPGRDLTHQLLVRLENANENLKCAL